MVTTQPFSATQWMWLPYGYESDWHFSASALQLSATLQSEWKEPMIIEPAGRGRGREQLRPILVRLSQQSSSSSRRNSSSHCLCTARVGRLVLIASYLWALELKLSSHFGLFSGLEWNGRRMLQRQRTAHCPWVKPTDRRAEKHPGQSIKARTA